MLCTSMTRKLYIGTVIFVSMLTQNQSQSNHAVPGLEPTKSINEQNHKLFANMQTQRSYIKASLRQECSAMSRKQL